MTGPDGERFTQALAKQHQPETADHLDKRQHRRARRVVVEIESLVNRQLDRRGPRTSAQRQHGRKAGETEHKDQRRNRRDLPPQPRPFNQPEKDVAAHAELGGDLPLLAGDIFQRLQQQARSHRHIKEHVRQQDPL